MATKKRVARKTKKTSSRSASSVSQPGIMRNQFFGMLVLAVGIGALIVMVRYFFISLQVPTDVYEISTQQLIPGAK